MATDIDSLEIKINAESKKANDAIDNLVGKIDKLTTSLSKIDGSKLSSLAYGVQKLGTSMQTMNNVKTADFTRLAKNLGKLNEVNVSQLGEVAKKVDAIGQSLGGLSSVSDGAKQLGELANGIKQLGYKSSEKAITNIPQLAKAVKQLMVELSKAPKVSQNLIDMTNALAKLARTGSSSGKAATSLSNAFNTYSKSTVKAKTHTFSLASAIGKLYASYWVLFRAFGKIRDAINISSDLTEVQNVVDVTFGKYANLVEKMSETSITDFGMSELTVKEVSSRFQSMGTAMGFAQGKMADMSVELTKLTADMASFYNVEQKDVAEDLESIFTGQTRPLRTYGLDLTEATLKEWALKQGLDANIDSMSQAQKTMLRYQYVLANTGAAQGDFARTSDTWANQTRILKQNLEQLATVLGGTLINALKPLVKAFNVVIGQVVTFAKVISNALGKIFGWTYEESGVGGVASDFESASDSANDIASSTGKAADNIKKMKAGLRAFDELNVINISDSGSSSGGSGGSSSGGASSGTGGQWTQTESIIKNFESEIDTLYKLGERIGSTLINAMESIEWDSVYEKARGFGSGLAEFLNGIFAGQNGITLFGAVGKTIAGALNTVIQSALSFGQTFDFEQFGVNIADGINRFFETFNFEDLANTINAWVQGIWKTLTTAISKIDWKGAWDEAIKLLENIDLDTINIILGAVVIKGILSPHLASTALSMIGTALSRSIAQAIASKLGIEIAANAGIKTAITTGLTQAFTSIGTTFMAGLKGLFGSEAALSALSFISPITKAITGIGSVISGVAIAVTNFLDMWKTGFTWLKETLMVLGTALTAVGAIILGAPALVAGVVAGIVAVVATIAVVVHDNWDAICEFTKGLWKNIVNIFTPAANWFSENVIEPIVRFFDGLKKRVKQVFEGLWIIVKAIWIVVANWFNSNVITPLVNFFSPIVNKVGGFFVSLWNNIRNVWSSVANWFKTTIINPVSNAFKTACNNISGFFTSLWSGIKKGVASAMNAVISGIEKAINKIVSGINGIIGGFNKIVTVAAEIVGANWSGVSKLSKVSLGRISVSGYELGGFVENNLPSKYSLFMAGEHGKPEMLGTVGGKTAVAGGSEITGIREEIRATANEEMELLRQQNNLLQAILSKEFGITKDDIGRAARSYANDYYKRTGREAYSF